MVIYRVSFFTKSGESKGFEYYAGDVIARAAARWAEERGEKAEVNSFEVPLTRDGLLRALHQFGMHADESLHAESKSKPPPEKRRLKFSLYNLRDIRGPVCHNHLRAYGYDLCMKTTNHILICIVSAYTSACFAQVVSNGDFEIPQVPSGIGVYSPTNATWVWPSGGTNGGIISPPGFIPSESASFQAPAAPTGNQIAFVQMAFSNYATMSESITLPADGIYRLSYYDAGRPTWAPGVGGNTTYNVLLDTNIIATVSTTTGQPFTPEAFTFSSQAGQHVLTFGLFAEPTYDNTAFFDDIAVAYVGPKLSIDTYAGLTITGAVGSTNQIQYVSSLTNTNWITLTNLVLPQSPYLFFDPSTSARSGKRFYRVVELQ